MDVTRFDSWSRRRFGRAAGGFTAALLALAGPAETEAKRKRRKKRRKKRCKNVHATCSSGGKRTCCGSLGCSTTANNGSQTTCCRPEGPCLETPQGQPDDCCLPAVCVDNLCQTPSDRALKANFGSVDPADMLARVSALPIATWNYTADDPAVRHIGPMAQDFAALFGVGTDDRHINPIDGHGVALAAIQGLAARIDALHAENARLTERIDELAQLHPQDNA